APRGPQLDPGPQHQWDDWKWQQQNAIRSVSQLRHLLPFTRDELEAIGKLETEYKLMIQCMYRKAMCNLNSCYCLNIFQNCRIDN
ncbi:MAG: hypothetical protein ACK56I_14070, partial [bacterium]